MSTEKVLWNLELGPLCRALRQERIQAGMTIREYAAVLGIDRCALHRMEQEECVPSARTLCILMLHFKYQPKDVLVPYEGARIR